jgi:hypothetical protein
MKRNIDLNNGSKMIRLKLSWRKPRKRTNALSIPLAKLLPKRTRQCHGLMAQNAQPLLQNAKAPKLLQSTQPNDPDHHTCNEYVFF